MPGLIEERNPTYAAQRLSLISTTTHFHLALDLDENVVDRIETECYLKPPKKRFPTNSSHLIDLSYKREGSLVCVVNCKRFLLLSLLLHALESTQRSHRVPSLFVIVTESDFESSIYQVNQ